MEGNNTITNHTNLTSIPSSNSSSYARSGKVMLSSVIVTFSVVVIIVFFHSYARCIFLRRHRRRLHLQFHSDAAAGSSSANVLRGLDASVVKNLPTFLHSAERDSPLECAVCLSEFEEQEKGRVLPACGHKFHVGCIDMWFFSHSNCPLCRSSVVILHQPDQSLRTEKNLQDFVVSVSDEAQVEQRSGNQSQIVADEKGSSSSSSSSSPTFGINLVPMSSERMPLEVVISLEPQ